MNEKTIWKIALDCLMIVLLPLLMAYSLIGEKAHEWLGAVMFLLFLGHHALNWRWYRGLPKGKWTARRLFQTAVNIALLLCMLGLMVSGVMISRYVFSFLPISGGRRFARTLHMLTAYWGFCLMSLHLGMHWNMVLGMVRNVIKKQSIQRTWFFRAAAAAIAGYGLYAFSQREIYAYLFLQSHFVFFDFNEPRMLFFLDYVAVIAFMTVIGHYAAKLLSTDPFRHIN